MIPTGNSPSLRRRQFLAAGGSVGALAAAGCLGRVPSVSAPIALGVPEERIQMDGRERHLVFAENGEEYVTVSVRQRGTPRRSDAGVSDRLPFGLLVHPAEGRRIERLTVLLRGPPADGSPFAARIYLQPPPTASWPAFTLTRGTEGWAEVSVDGLGARKPGVTTPPGDSNVWLDLVVEPVSNHPIERLELEAEIDLSEKGVFGRRRYRATTKRTFEIVQS